MLIKKGHYWLTVLGISVTALVCGGVALVNAAIVADENNVQNLMNTPLWIIFAAGIVGALISLPGWIATRGICK